VRYSTTGGSIGRNVQPMFADLTGGGLAIAHNGNLTTARALRRDLVREGAIFQSTSDTEAIIHLAARSHYELVVEKLIDALKHVEGAYSLVALTSKKLIGVRDAYGVRPLVLGRLDDAWISRLRNLRARHHRRRVRARYRTWRDGGHHDGRN
jgi:amidophosphoribosyltransferase